jgi:hypothetical protein
MSKAACAAVSDFPDCAMTWLMNELSWLSELIGPCVGAQNCKSWCFGFSKAGDRPQRPKSAGADDLAHRKSCEQEFDQIALTASLGLLEYFGEPGPGGSISDLQLGGCRPEFRAAGQKRGQPGFGRS